MKITVAAALIFVVFSAVTGGEESDLAPSLQFERSGDRLLLRDPISAAARASVNGSDYLFVMTKFGKEPAEAADLRIVSAGPEDDLAQVGWIHTSMMIETPPSAIAVTTDHVYVGLTSEEVERSALWVVDVSNPRSPFEANLISVEMPVRGLAASEDGYLIASGYDDRFLVFDISVPNEPEVISTFQAPIAVAPRIELIQSTLVIDDMAGIALMDASDPEQPARVGEILHPDWSAPAVNLQSGGFLSGEEGFDGAVPAGSFLQSTIEGDLLAIAASEIGLLLVDISDPANPASIGELEIEGRAARVAVRDERTYVLGVRDHSGSDLLYHLHTVDISDPGSPLILETSGDITGMPRYQGLFAGDDHVLLLFNDAVLRFESSD